MAPPRNPTAPPASELPATDDSPADFGPNPSWGGDSDCGSDGVRDVDEDSVRIRYEEKGPANLGWNRRLYNRRAGDVLEVRRHRQRATPGWAADLPDRTAANQRIETLRATADVNAGYSGLVANVVREIRRDVANVHPLGGGEIRPAEVAPEVTRRFMERYEQLAGSGVRPRIVYHGTQPDNLASIRRTGLLPPPKFHPEGWYTDAIWTAPKAQTSLGYCGAGNVMYGCVVLDEKVRDPGTAANNHDDDEDDNDAAAAAPAAPEVGQRTAAASGRQRGRRQHRQTRRPALRPPTGKKSSPQPISYVNDYAVLVRDEALICPCVEIEWDPDAPPRVAQQLQVPTQNHNTLCEDHASQTLSNAYFNDTQSRHHRKLNLQVARRCAKRDRDVQRLRLRAAKSSAIADS